MIRESIYEWVYIVVFYLVNIHKNIIDSGTCIVANSGLKKTIPVQAWTGPLGFRRLRSPEFLDSQHMKMVRLSVLCTGCLYPQGDSWFSFLLEAELTPELCCGQKDQVSG
jgi:hypothetical protein